MGWWDSGLVRRWVIGLPAYHCRLSAICFPPPTSHPERQRRISVPAVSDTYANKYQSAGRHQTIRQSDIRKRYSRKQGGSGAFRRPGSRPRRGCAPGGLRFRPQSGLVQRGVLYAAFGGYKIAAKPPPQPFEPSEPCEPSEPGTRSGPMGAEPSEPGRGAAIII